MTKPDDIPQDVWDAAWESMLPSWKAAADGMPYPNIEFNQSIIARAILAERERCAKVAEDESNKWNGCGNFMGDGYGDGARNATLKLASDIRKSNS